MKTHEYLKTIDIDYRIMSRMVEELESKEERTEDEENRLEELKSIMEEKKNEITLKD